jgi:SAM-dependent methyltransferase
VSDQQGPTDEPLDEAVGEVVGRWERPYEPAPTEGPEAYDRTYADRYDEDWWESERWGPEAENHVASLRPLLARPGVRWLDCACGTGWLLSRFPGVARAGFDLTPAMLEHARAANPDALFIEQGDLRRDVPAWRDGFDVVTCTGQPWMYLPSMADVSVAVANMAAWTRPDGVLFVPIADLTDLAGVPLDPNPAGGRPPEGLPVITGALWSQWEYGGMHHHMIAPSLSAWIDLFSRHFLTVEVQRWPHAPGFLPLARRILVGRDKRPPGDTGPTQVVERAVPGTSPRPGEPGSMGGPELAPDEGSERELARLAERVEQLVAERDDVMDRLGDAERRAGEGSAALAREAEAARHPAHVCPPNRSAAEVPTGSLARELVRRSTPGDGRALRAAWRRIRRLGPSR